MASTFKSHEVEDGSVMIRGMASTNHSDRAGDVIAAEAWSKGGLENFKNNPVILFNHDYDKPIGRATGVKVTDNGLELEAKISKSAPAAVCELVKDGVLGAFSVGFKVKDADYIKETDGLMIKDAELFEVSVVSVPCNQAATFSLAKSFDSIDEYNEFKKTFTNRVDLAGQSLAKDEDTSSNIASDHTPKSAEKSADQEIKMDNQNIDLEAFAKQVAEDTAAKIAMKQAEQKAAEQNLSPQETDEFILNMMLAPDGPIMEMLRPFLSQQLGLEALSDVQPAGILLGGRNGVTSEGVRIYSQSDDVGDKIQKSFMHLMNAIEPGLFSTGQKFIKGATGDLTKGGQPVNLKDEITALLSGVRIINIDVLKSMEYKTGEFNRLMRAIDDTEKLYSPEGYNSRGPETILQEYNQMKLEGYKVQQNFHRMIVDAKTIGVSTFDIRKKLKDQGVGSKMINNLYFL